MSGRSVLFAAAVAVISAAAGNVAAAPACNLQKLAELPVRMMGFRPAITTQVNGAEAHMLVDTGVFQTVVSRASAERFGLRVVPAPMRFHLRGVGGEEADVGFAEAKDFNFAGAQFHDVGLMVAGRAGGRALDGNVGLNLLAFADVEFDLAHQVIRLFHPEGCPGLANRAYWAEAKQVNWLDIPPIDKETQHIRGEAVVNGHKLRVIFDTGAGRSGLTRAAAEKLGFKVDGPDVRPGGFVHGFGPRSVESWIMPVDLFSMGGEEIHNTRLRVIDNRPRDHDMVIGADFFLAHRVYVSRTGKRVFFTYNGSGPVFLLDKPPPAEPELGETPAAQ